ncbi:hypothetical protein COB57_00010 [Candidatus Peregrinibacteria bacterium]|nr:MAG: hypothetical protein COB57_00010 [Candidatus Peregrinibacteria bacterium]
MFSLQKYTSVFLVFSLVFQLFIWTPAFAAAPVITGPIAEASLNTYVLSVNINGDSCDLNPVVDTSKYVLTNAPAGLTIVGGVRTADQVVNLTLAYVGNMSANITNFHIAIDVSQIIFSGDIACVPASANTNQITIQQTTASLGIVEDAAMTETNLDLRSLVISLTGDAFIDGILDKNNFTFNNAPVGTTVEGVVYATPLTAGLTIAFDGTDFDVDVNNFSITIAAAELSDGSNLTSNVLNITSVVEASLDSIAYNNGVLATVTDDAITLDFDLAITGAGATTDYAIGFDTTGGAFGGIDVGLNNDGSDYAISLDGGNVIVTLTAAGLAKIDDIGELADDGFMGITIVNTANLTPSIAGTTALTKALSHTVDIIAADPAPTASLDTIAYNNGVLATLTDDSITLDFDLAITGAGATTDYAIGFDTTGGAFGGVDIGLNNDGSDYAISLDGGNVIVTLTAAGLAKIDDIGELADDGFMGITVVNTENLTPNIAGTTALTKALSHTADIIAADPVPGSAALTSAAITENNLDKTVITITLTGDSFIDATLDKNNFTLSAFPGGTTISGVSYTDATHADITMAFDGTDFDIDGNGVVTIAAAELNLGANIVSSSIAITSIVEFLSCSDPKNIHAQAGQLPENCFPSEWWRMEGGIVAGFDKDTGKGVVISEKDEGVMLYADQLDVTGATAVGAGAGVSNTTTLAVAHFTPNGKTYPAAAYCSVKSVGSFGSGSFGLIDSEGMLKFIDNYKLLSSLGFLPGDFNITANDYWSSTEKDINEAYYIDITSQQTMALSDTKTNGKQVRCGREFTVPLVKITPSQILEELSIETGTITISLKNDTFSDGVLDLSNFSLLNAPLGISIKSVDYIDGNNAVISLQTQGIDFDVDMTQVQVKILAAEMTSAKNIYSSVFTIKATQEASSGGGGGGGGGRSFTFYTKQISESIVESSPIEVQTPSKAIVENPVVLEPVTEVIPEVIQEEIIEAVAEEVIEVIKKENINIQHHKCSHCSSYYI